MPLVTLASGTWVAGEMSRMRRASRPMALMNTPAPGKARPTPDITATNWIWCAADKVKRWDRTAFFVTKRSTSSAAIKTSLVTSTSGPMTRTPPGCPARNGSALSQWPDEERKFRAVLDEMTAKWPVIGGLKRAGLDDRDTGDFH